MSGLSDLLTMGSDFGHMDPKGMEEFRKAFHETMTPPTEVMKTIEKGITRVFGVALSSVISVIAILILGFLFYVVFTGSMSIMKAVGIILFVAFTFWLGYIIFTTAMERELDYVAEDIRKRSGLYSETVLEELFTALKNGASAYVQNKEVHDYSADEDEIMPVD